MKTKYYFFAALATVMLASCADDQFVGDNSPTNQENANGVINFGFDVPNITRADIAGADAAAKLGNNFYVMGTKGTEATDAPTSTVVFDNYLVRFTANTAGKTESNTANWEYVGVTADANHDKLSPAVVTSQTIKFWDFSQPQYDFFAFSTGTKRAAKDDDSPEETEIGVTSMSSANLKTNAYKLYIPSTAALEDAFITDIVEVKRDDKAYGKDVVLKFKNLGSKVRVGLYETVPGYSIDATTINFYTVDDDGDHKFTDDKSTDAALISTNAASFAGAGTVQVFFPTVGTENVNKQDYNKASATVSGTSGGDTKKIFGTLATEKMQNKETSEADGQKYLGRTLPQATFAGTKGKDYYTTVFPVTTGYPLTLRVDYTLVSTDGSTETITVKGAKAVVPATYTVWQPNYAYTYIFKITDNTNGWTGANTDDAGLFPITFDAVVAQATEASGEQTTVTTVATPTITTYQQGHTYATNEYSKNTKGKDNVVRNLYVQVMDNSGTTSVLKNDLETNTPDGGAKSLLYKLGAYTTEAMVMDALENRKAAYDEDATSITGRNDVSLTLQSNPSIIKNDVTTIVNGVNDKVINLSEAGEAAMINMSSITTGDYAYVYDYTTAERKTGEITEYQPITVTVDDTDVSGKYHIAASSLTSAALTTGTEKSTDADFYDYIYFSKTTTNGGETYDYSYYSVAGKSTLPAGLAKYSKSSLTTATGTAAANTFYFDRYFSNKGKYAVKVIKIIGS